MGEYQREKAIEYARKWALSRNPAYISFEGFGGDCTNFVSQCLLVGGAKMNFTQDLGWYYRNGNDKAPAWSGVPYLYQFLMSGRRPGIKALETDDSGVEPGDIIQLSFDGALYSHTLFITEAKGNELYIATHTLDSLDRPLSSYDYEKARFLRIVGLRGK